MSIFVDENTKVIYQGLTGSQGSYYGGLNRAYGTQVVAAPTRRGGTDVDGVPIYASVAEAKEATGATANCIFIPAPGVQGAVLGGWWHRVHRGHHRACPPTMRRLLQQAEGRLPEHPPPGDCPGIISPGKANIGITAGHIAKAGGQTGI